MKKFKTAVNRDDSDRIHKLVLLGYGSEDISLMLRIELHAVSAHFKKLRAKGWFFNFIKQARSLRRAIESEKLGDGLAIFPRNES